MRQDSNLQELPFDNMVSSFTSYFAPARKFGDETLTRIAEVTTSNGCEYLRYLSELISSLTAFEQYSSECERRNVRDAALHDYLNKSIAGEWSIIETALQKLIGNDNNRL
jgi:hypothetical protein